ncbi:MAG: DUF3649 domain-containing protein [Pseudomonadota bacterium]
MSGLKSGRTRWHITARVALATIGGYLFANAIALVLVFSLPIDRLHGVVLGTLLTFPIWVGAVMWVFSAERLLPVTCKLLGSSVLMLGASASLYLLEAN